MYKQQSNTNFFERAFLNQKINIMGDGKENWILYIGDLCDGVYKIIKNFRNLKIKLSI